jgi:hypothetical protein
MMDKGPFPDFYEAPFSIKVGGLTADKQSMRRKPIPADGPCSAGFK